MSESAREPDRAAQTSAQSVSAKDSNTQPKAPTAEEDDSDPDFDDLDDVLDQFAANAPAKQSQSHPQSQSQTQTETQSQAQAQTQTQIQLAPSASGPGRPAGPTLPTAPQVNESEDEFLSRLASEMANMFPSSAAGNPAQTMSPEEHAKMAAEFEALTHKMEADGMKPEDLLKMVFGAEEAAKMADLAAQEAKSDAAAAAAVPASSSSSSSAVPRAASSGASTFEDTIRRTMSRLDQSNTEATNATAQSSTKSEEDLLAEMLKAFDSGQGGAGDEDGLSKMFLDMMQQLTHKEMLYEPMKELDDQYPAWLGEHQPPKLPNDDYERYKRQSVIVKDIVSKFEESGFSDDDPQCRQFIWDKMQQMQGEGAPPEELVKNPFPGTDFGNIPGLDGGGGEGGEGPDEGCPTQ